MQILDRNTVPRLAILGSAIAVTFASAADAALVSTTPAGFLPVTITQGTDTSYSFDMDANGSMDFTVLGGQNLTLEILDGTSGAATLFGTLSYSPSAADLAIGNIKQASSSVGIGDYGTSRYSALVTNATFAGSNATAGTLGYMLGSYIPGDTPSFQLQDFGLVAVPEPSTWLMLVTGMGGIGLMRRRNRARHEPSLAG